MKNSTVNAWLRWMLVLTALTVVPVNANADVLDSKVAIDSDAYVVVSSSRVARTVFEYTLRAVADNSTATRYTNVTASLVSVPSNVTIVDGIVDFGTVEANARVTSTDTFVIRINVLVATSLADLIWRVEGTPPATGPGPGSGGSGKPAAVGIFMSIDDNDVIKGESRSNSHPDWIELLSFSEGSSNTASIGDGTGGSAGKLNLHSVDVTKFIDSSSPLTRLALAEGDIFTEVKIDIVKSCGGNIFTQYAITLTASSIIAIGAGGSGGEDRLTESLSFNFSRIETAYTPVKADCSLQSPIYSYQDIVKG